MVHVLLLHVTHVLPQVPDPMARYKQLLFYAAKLPPMTAEQHKPENKVEGCVSQVR
jgi:sulfur transfer protein SufE